MTTPTAILSSRPSITLTCLALALLIATPAPAQRPGPSQAESAETAAVEAVVAAYHQALAGGDRETALAILSPEVMILESGHVETAEEYRAHHLAADMAFSAAVPSRRQIIQAVVAGEVGWVISTSTVQGRFRDREIDSLGAELMVLRKQDGLWKIRAIHWSSRRRK